MAAELPRPGVEVIQVFQSSSPTVVTPTLAPCIVGVCRQEVNVLVPAASGTGQQLNTAAVVPLPAQIDALPGSGSPPVYSGLDGLHLSLSIDNNPAVVTAFAGTVLSPAQVVAQIAAAFTAAGVTAALVETVGTSSFRIRTVGTGQFESLQVLPGTGVTDPAVMTTFGIGPREYVGHTGYDQHGLVLPQENFPNPGNNLPQLAIESDSIRAFLYLGGTTPQLKELLQTQAFLCNGVSTQAVMTFTADLTGGGVVAGLDTQTLSLVINGGTPLVTTFATPSTPANVVTQVQAVISSVATASLDVTGKFLVITTTAANIAATIAIPTGTATGLGFPGTAVAGSPAAAAVTTGSGTLTPLMRFPGQNFTASATAAVTVGTVAIPGGGVPDGDTLILDDGYTIQTIVFESATTPTLVLAQINAVVGAPVGGFLHASLSTSSLSLASTLIGATSQVGIVGGTALGTLGLSVGTAFGSPFPVAPGDAVYLNGVLFATVVKVAPGGAVDTLKINQQIPIAANLGDSFYLRAQNLTDSTTFGVTRPTPDLQIDLMGQPLIQPDILRDTRGYANTSLAQLYLAYSAIREDVSPKAQVPGLLQFSDTTSLTNALAPVDVSNPLALGMYFALLNSPGVQVTGIGVDQVSSAEPFGTVEAFTRAATFLESFEVYAIAPMTHDDTVGQVFNTHVTVMSEPANKGERIVLVNPSQPTRRNDTLVSSGVNGNSGATTNTFDTGVQNLDALLLGLGVNPVGAIAVTSGLYLAAVDSPNFFAIVGVSGSLVTVQTSSFQPGENDDSFYATTTLSPSYIEEAFAVRIRGTALVLPDGTPDKPNMALAIAGKASAVLNRRYWQVSPDKCAATIGGVEQKIDGFYMCAAIAGMIGQQPPQQSFTNYPMTGFTQVIGSNGYFSESQLNQMAAAGCYIIVQDAPGAPLTARMALTTDMTSIETRTDSITKVVDFCAKFYRTGLKNFIGRFNITQGFLDSLSHVVQGLSGFLTESGVLIGASLDNIVQDVSAPDTVLLEIVLDVPFPCNFIKLTLVV